MKKLLTLCLAGVMALTLCACTGNASAPSKTADMEQMQKTMLAADTSLPKMLSITNAVEDAPDLFPYLSDFDYDKVDSFLLSYAEAGTAEELAVIAVKDKADVEAAAQSLQDHVASRRKLFQTYTPAEAVRLDKAQIFTQDQYAVLIICNDPDTVKSAFQSALSA